MYSSVAGFLVQNGIGEATDVLLIDEKLCVGCDNCEKACADSHEGLSRLNREAGRTFAHLHVPTSCRHCEHPHCMADCPPNAINRGPDGEVYINDTCIGCGNCQRNCPYGVIRMAKPPPQEAEPVLLAVLRQGAGPRRTRQEMDRRQGQFGDSKKSDQMRHVFWYRGWAGMRSRLSDGCRDPGFAGRVPHRGEDGTGGLSEGGKQGDEQDAGFGDGTAHESFLRYRRYRWFKIGAFLSLLLIVVYLFVDVAAAPQWRLLARLYCSARSAPG